MLNDVIFGYIVDEQGNAIDATITLYIEKFRLTKTYSSENARYTINLGDILIDSGNRFKLVKDDVVYLVFENGDKKNEYYVTYIDDKNIENNAVLIDYNVTLELSYAIRADGVLIIRCDSNADSFLYRMFVCNKAFTDRYSGCSSDDDWSLVDEKSGDSELEIGLDTAYYRVEVVGYKGNATIKKELLIDNRKLHVANYDKE